jgi:hypothetical protein
MKASLLKTIRKPGDGKKRGLNNKVITFAICLVIAGFLWLMNVLSKKYTDTITFQVAYQHLPQDKKLYPSSPSINVKVFCSGFNLVAYTFGIKEAEINIDANSFRHNWYNLQNRTHQEKIEDQLGDQMKVLEIAPDTLFLRTTPTQD